MEEKRRDNWLINILIYVLSFFLALPVSVVFYPYISELPISNVQVKFSISFILGFVLIAYMIRSLKKLVMVVVCITIVGLTINSYRENKYNFTNLFDDYNSILFSLIDRQNGLSIVALDGFKENKTEQIKAVADFDNPKVRKYAVSAATTYYNDDNLYYKYGDIVRYFSIFKVIKDQWTYVRDPSGEEYFAKASESIDLMAGDCDDYTILMASCIKAVGGHVRMVHVKGHIYPEVNVGTIANFDQNVAYAVTSLFRNEYDGVQLRGHIDAVGNVWLNFDYTANYPGGPFLNDEIIRIVEI